MKNEVYLKEHKKTFLFFQNNYAFVCNSSKELMTILIFQLNQKNNDIGYKKKE